MPIWLLPMLKNNWKPIALFLLIAGIGGYIWFLRGDIVRQQEKINILNTSLSVANADISNAKMAITGMQNSQTQLLKFVKDSNDAVRRIQTSIVEQDLKLQKLLDNLAVQATAARRIEDAPVIPFFMFDNVTVSAVDNGFFGRLRGK